ncbi:MAG TPA: serine/threonine-protein kinase [Kofleriaceae bacterium]|nr:serine/threonine-protein kinase [Kofleriaceae bacterium]
MLVRTVGGDDATVTDPRASRAAASLLLSPGSLLAGRYRIERFLAAGGMGEVHEVLDELLGERVAVKLLREDLSHKRDAQERFTDEIRLARRVTHRNVCRVFDVGVDGPRVFFTMELHRGETLASFLRREGPLEPDRAAPLVGQILEGVGAAHASDVVHADLKPSNIILDPRDEGGLPHVLVTDFGLAVSCCAVPGCVCSSAHLVGTPAYMSPEQVTGDPIGRATDIFSLGVILFEMVTGELPYSGDSVVEMANARLAAAEPPSPAAIRPALSPRWDSAIRACLAREPAARPSSVADLAQALAVA